MRRILLVSLATAVAACSVFGDFGQYSTEDASNGAEAGPASGIDGGGDGSGASADGGSDGASPDSGPSFCTASTHAFCADFEDDAALAAWSNRALDPTGVIELSTTHAKEGKRALRTKLARHAADIFNAELQKQLAGPWRPTHVELDLWLEPPDWQDGDINASVLALSYVSGTSSVSFFVVVGVDYCNLGGADVADTFGPPIPTGKWLHVVADLSTTKLEVTIDGVKRTHEFSITQGGGAARFELGAGIEGFNAPAPVFDVYYDNVTVDFE